MALGRGSLCKSISSKNLTEWATAVPQSRSTQNYMQRPNERIWEDFFWVWSFSLTFSVFYPSHSPPPTSTRALKDKVTKGVLRGMKEEGIFRDHLWAWGFIYRSYLNHLNSSLSASSLNYFQMVFWCRL